jgi:hypothetical protein
MVLAYNSQEEIALKQPKEGNSSRLCYSGGFWPKSAYF